MKAAVVSSRRSFLKASASITVAFQMGWGNSAVHAKPLTLDEVDSFIAIQADGSVTLYTGKVELGQGIRTAMAQIVAEELDVTFASVKVIEGDTLLTPAQGLTGGSVSIHLAGQTIRRAAATARWTLVQAASEKMGVAATAVQTRDGRCIAGSSSLAYAQLVPSTGFALKVDPKAVLKSVADYRVVGKSVQRVDVRLKVRGQYQYVHDVVRPGMVHARVIRPSAVGATLQGFDDTGAKRLTGYLGAVRIGSFLAVTARSEWAAIQASRQIVATWSGGGNLPVGATVEQVARAAPVAKRDVTAKKGEPAAVLADVSRPIQAAYDWPIQTHGSIGPSCAVAEYIDGELTCWTASQATHDLQKQVAALIGLQESKVRMIYVDGAGCYGRNGHEDCAADAALIARHTGKPVRVQWMRNEEHGWDPKGPGTFHEYKGAIGQDGKIIAWTAQTWVPNHEVGVVALLASQAVGQEQPTGLGVGLMKNNSDPPYDIPNVHSVVHQMASTPLRASWIRTPGRMQNVYAVESFMDEMAHAAKQDPVIFRLAHLKDPRGRETIEKAALKFGWLSRPAYAQDRGAPISRGQGLAYLRYNNVGTYVAAFAQVSVNRQTGEIKAEKFTVAHDCGLVINPDGIRQNVEGNVLQTVSRVLKESVSYDANLVTSVDWASYPIARFSDMPSLDVVIINRPDLAPTGAGEPTAAAVPAAIANAVFDATGVRLRSIPFTPEKVLAALRQAGA